MHSFSRIVNQRLSSASFNPSRIIPGISAGLVAGIIHIVILVSFAALIFSGRLSGFVSRGIGFILIGNVLALIVTNLFSSYRGTLSIAQDAPVTIMAVIAVGLMRTRNAGIPSQDVFLTLSITMATSALLTGLVFFLLGAFRVGALIRYLPYPVIGGFLAGTGWLLVIGGIGTMSGGGGGLGSLSVLVQSSQLSRWLPGVVFAFIMLAVVNRYHQSLVLPGLILGSGVLFFIISGIAGVSPNQLLARGWLLGPFPAGSLWQPFNPQEFSLVRWGDILAQAGSLFTIVLVSTVSFLLNISGIEIATQHDLHLDRELKVAGIGNLLSGVVGGSVNYPTLATTALNHRLGRDSRVTGWVVLFLYGLILFFGATLLNYVPKMVLGGLLVFLGLSFLWEWVVQAYTRFPFREYVIIPIILVVIAVFGYLPGVALGLLTAIALFVMSYSRINVIKYSLTGKEFHSRVTRPVELVRCLQQYGESILIYQLQGYIFFGTANHLLDRIRQHLEKHESGAGLEFFILDFGQVTGLDSTAMLSFERMRQFSKQHAIALLFSSVSPKMLKTFEQAGFQQHGQNVCIYPDLDHAVQWAEDLILDTKFSGMQAGSVPLVTSLGQILPDSTHLQALLNYFERQDLAAGTYLIHQGDQPDDIFFIESGQVTAQLEYPGKDPIRLETMQGGRMVGELGFYLGIPRTAAVITDQPSVVYKLSRDALRSIEAEDSISSSVFHKLLATLLAERVTHLIESVNALQRS